ncbi:MAG TPA: PilZ domain-containing protein [Terriglobales bacterium]|nr:PilZ domain-containing protein [Terriglobales bacterium]
MVIHERRQYPRVSVDEIVNIRSPHCPEDASAIARNLSLGGAFLEAGHCVDTDAQLGMFLILPSELTRTRDVRAWCLGKVLRKNQHQPGRFQVAIKFEHYEPFPDEEIAEDRGNGESED